MLALWSARTLVTVDIMPGRSVAVTTTAWSVLTAPTLTSSAGLARRTLRRGRPAERDELLQNECLRNTTNRLVAQPASHWARDRAHARVAAGQLHNPACASGADALIAAQRRVDLA